MTIHPLIKVNFAALVLLFIAVFFTHMMFFKVPDKDAVNKFKNKKAQKVAVFLARAFFVLLSVGLIIFGNIPVLRDTFSGVEPITLTGKVESADRGLFFPLTYSFSQGFIINDVSLHIYFYPKIIIEGKTYKVTYLPHSRAVLTIERLD